MRVQSSLRHARGFTLIELMVAMVVSAIVVLGIFAFSTIQQTTTGIHERNVRVQQALEGAMFSIGQDVRSAGLGWSRLCTELRVWDAENNRLINPGGANIPANAVTDDVTGEAYWVLRDGIQAHWNSSGAGSLAGAGGAAASSARPDSAADALDVIVAEPNYTGSIGVFTLAATLTGADAAIRVNTGPALDSTIPTHVAEVQQLFPPGSFVVLVNPPNLSFRAEQQSQCVLMQVTADVAAGAGAQEFSIPIANSSGFNNINGLMVDNNGAPGGDDWDPTAVNVAGASVIPVGRLRWSRYELDYSINRLPYLVRYDLIGFQEDVDVGNLGAVDYPHCDAGTCPQPSLHLPGSGSPPQAVAIGPMIEDMQVAVGCDGYTPAGAASADATINDPDLTFEEVGPAEGPFAGLANLTVDENTPASGQRTRDEWLGNAVEEAWAPDCVYYGTGEYAAADWALVEGDQNPPPAFRMSPQAVRITLVGSGEFAEEAGGLGSNLVIPVEDRPEMASDVGVRQRFSLTERFAPENLRWRDPQIQ
ncbi:MAG: prepilin-type N-terminal cleavage/methylation domain-containing protein [Myxococcota bacterium]